MRALLSCVPCASTALSNHKVSWNFSTKAIWHSGNAMHAVRTQCEVLDVDKYSNPSFGPFSQVFGSVPGFCKLPKHLGCGIFELSRCTTQD